jgi:RNA polymerase sigma-70 factor, ECF subfamily
LSFLPHLSTLSGASTENPGTAYAATGGDFMYSSIAVNQPNASETKVRGRDDDMLVAAATCGDAAAFETLVIRYKRIVLAVTRRMTGSFVDAEDLTQQAFMKAFANLSRFGGRCSFCTWLVSIAMNEARMWNRKARRSLEVPMTSFDTGELFELPIEFMDPRPGPEANYAQKERSRLLLSALNGLKPETRDALKLCDLDEESTANTALVLGISVNALKSRRLRGRAMLRRKLEKSHLRKRSQRSCGSASVSGVQQGSHHTPARANVFVGREMESAPE